MHDYVTEGACLTMSVTTCFLYTCSYGCTEKLCLVAAPLPPDMVEALDLLDIAEPDTVALQAML